MFRSLQLFAALQVVICAVGQDVIRQFQELSRDQFPTFDSPRFLLRTMNAGIIVTAGVTGIGALSFDSSGYFTGSTSFPDTGILGGNVLPNGSFILVGYSFQAGQPTRAVAVWLNSDGSEQKRLSFSGKGQQNTGADFRSATPRSSGGLLLAGGSSTEPGSGNAAQHGGSDGWVVALDAEGNKEWDLSFGGPGNDDLGWGFETPDGGFVFGGRRDGDINTGRYNAWLFKANSSGGTVWEYREPGWINACVKTKDDGFVFTSSYSPSITKMDGKGIVIWRTSESNSHPSSRQSAIYSLLELRDGRLIALVISYGSPTTETIRCLDRDGNLVWETTPTRTLGATTGPIVFFDELDNSIGLVSNRNGAGLFKLASDSVGPSSSGVFFFSLPEFRPDSLGRIPFSLVGESGKTYVVEHSQDLQNWNAHSTNTIGTHDEKFFANPTTGGSQGYFRAREVE